MASFFSLPHYYATIGIVSKKEHLVVLGLVASLGCMMIPCIYMASSLEALDGFTQSYFIVVEFNKGEVVVLKTRPPIRNGLFNSRKPICIHPFRNDLFAIMPNFMNDLFASMGNP